MKKNANMLLVFLFLAFVAVVLIEHGSSATGAIGNIGTKIGTAYAESFPDENTVTVPQQFSPRSVAPKIETVSVASLDAPE